MKRAAFFDIDGTLTSERAWRGVLEYFQKNRLRLGVHWLFLGLHYPLYFIRRARLISESTFRSNWAAHMAWYVRGYTVEQAQVVWDWAVEQHIRLYWRADMLAILDQHRQAGDLVALVSSGPLPLIERVARELGVEHAVGTKFELHDGRYTGRASRPVVIDDVKASAAQQYFNQKGLEIDLTHSFAYADSIADLQLLEMTGNPTAVYPDQALLQIARNRDWRIIPDKL